jgi:hypothetical protein
MRMKLVRSIIDLLRWARLGFDLKMMGSGRFGKLWGKYLSYLLISVVILPFHLYSILPALPLNCPPSSLSSPETPPSVSPPPSTHPNARPHTNPPCPSPPVS